MIFWFREVFVLKRRRVYEEKFYNICTSGNKIPTINLNNYLIIKINLKYGYNYNYKPASRIKDFIQNHLLSLAWRTGLNCAKASPL